MSVEEWVVLELSPRSEGEDPDAIRQAISKHVPAAEVFVPAVVTQIGDDRVVYSLVEGYAFVQRVYPDSLLFRLEGTRYVQGVLAEPGGAGRHRQPSIVRTADVDRMRRQIQREINQGIGIGDRVRITTGAYKNIEATVIEETPETKTVQVFVRLRSKEAIVTIPRSGLMVLDRSPLSPLLSRLTDCRSWLRLLWPVVMWRPRVQFEAIAQEFQKYERLHQATVSLRRSLAFAFFFDATAKTYLEDIRKRQAHLEQLTAWNTRLLNILLIFTAYAGTGAFWESIRAHYKKLEWLDGLQSRIQRLQRDLDHLASKISHQDGDVHMVQNVLVDGNNLARRCYHAPGMAEIQTSKGEPTGVILGVLRSLGALSKRFPGAQIVIAWDGATRRRKKVFGEYKAGRAPVPKGFPEQVAAIQKILPTLGIRQALNPDEEADDILATLVRGELNHQNNLIFSSDRDFLQLVSSTTSVLVPGAGIRKEILFDEDRVKEHFGVPPEKVLQFRAFVGDETDNIPGVARVPKKVLCSLIQAFGSVEAVYRSGLTGVTKGQYERLRSSEPQVRINLGLMSLVDVPISSIDSDVDPDLATSRIQAFEINPGPILEAFFGRKPEIADA